MAWPPSLVEYMPPRVEATITVLPPARPTGPLSVYLKVRPVCARRSIQALSWVGTREVVERRADHDHVGRQELAHQLLGDGVLAALGFGRLGLHADLDAERIGAEVVGGVHRQVEVVDRGVRDARLRQSATISAVSWRETELAPRTLESTCSSFMIIALFESAGTEIGRRGMNSIFVAID